MMTWQDAIGARITESADPCKAISFDTETPFPASLVNKLEFVSNTKDLFTPFLDKELPHAITQVAQDSQMPWHDVARELQLISLPGAGATRLKGDPMEPIDKGVANREIIQADVRRHVLNACIFGLNSPEVRCKGMQ